jgi:hypothetical protein
MRSDRSSTLLRGDRVALVAVLLAMAASIAGLVVPRLYRDAELLRDAWRVNDAVTLLVAAPVLLFARSAARDGSAPARLVWLGMLHYLSYDYGFYLFGAALNPLLLVYAAIVALSGWAIALSLGELDVDTVARRRGGGGRARDASRSCGTSTASVAPAPRRSATSTSSFRARGRDDLEEEIADPQLVRPRASSALDDGAADDEGARHGTRERADRLRIHRREAASLLRRGRLLGRQRFGERGTVGCLVGDHGCSPSSRSRSNRSSTRHAGTGPREPVEARGSQKEVAPTRSRWHGSARLDQLPHVPPRVGGGMLRRRGGSVERPRGCPHHVRERAGGYGGRAARARALLA